MSKQDLNQADIHALLKHVRGKTVAQRVRPEIRIEAALASRLRESSSCGFIAQWGHESTTGKEPLRTPVNLPDFPEHLQNRFGQRKNPLLVSLSDDTQGHLLGVNRRDGESGRLVDSQAIGIGQRETAAIDRASQRCDQAAAVRIAANVGQPLLPWLTHFFLVSNGQS